VCGDEGPHLVQHRLIGVRHGHSGTGRVRQRRIEQARGPVW
jgi:hypothetical protein